MQKKCSMIYLILPPKAEEGWIKPDQCQVNSTLLELTYHIETLVVSWNHIECSDIFLPLWLICGQCRTEQRVQSCFLLYLASRKNVYWVPGNREDGILEIILAKRDMPFFWLYILLISFPVNCHIMIGFEVNSIEHNVT